MFSWLVSKPWAYAALELLQIVGSALLPEQFGAAGGSAVV